MGRQHSGLDFEIRPHFQFVAQADVTAVEELLHTQLAASPLRGRVQHGYAVIKPSADDIQYWSPHLSMSLESEDDGTTLIRGHYGPAPAVWTMFVFFYSIIALAFVIIGVIGLANISVDESGAVLWLLPLLFAIFSSLYAVSYIGQKKSRHQIAEMHNFVRSCLHI